MREILITLNQEASIAGSMVITPDGIMVAAALGPDLEEETVAAFASGLLLGVKRSLSILRASGELNSCTLHASKGKITFFDMKNCYLVVVADPAKRMDGSLGAIKEAMHKIRNRRVA